MSTTLLAEVAILALTAGAWLSLALVAQDVARRRLRIEWLDALLAASLFGIAFALRWWLPIHTTIHENKHGLEIDPYLPLDAAITRNGVVYGHLVLIKIFRYLAPLGGEAAAAAFAMNALLSAVAVPGMFALARQVFASRLAGVTAASLLLFQPLAVMMAPTEEYLVAATGLCLAERRV